MGRILYTNEAIERISGAMTLLRTQVEQLAEAPLMISDGRGLCSAVSTGEVLISVGLTEDCRPDGRWTAMSVGGYHLQGQGASPEEAVVQMYALEDRLQAVLYAIRNSRCDERRAREDLLYEQAASGGVLVDKPYAPIQEAARVDLAVIDGEICCIVYGTLREEVIALLEDAGLPIAPDCK